MDRPYHMGFESEDGMAHTVWDSKYEYSEHRISESYPNLPCKFPPIVYKHFMSSPSAIFAFELFC